MLIQIIYCYILSNIPIEYELFLNRSIWYTDETLTGTNTPCQSGPGSNGNEGILYTLLISTTGVLPLDTV